MDVPALALPIAATSSEVGRRGAGGADGAEGAGGFGGGAYATSQDTDPSLS